MKAKLVLANGQEIEVDLSEEEVAKLSETVKVPKLKVGDDAFFINFKGEIDVVDLRSDHRLDLYQLFYTSDEAEEEFLRMESRAKRFDWIPEKGERFFLCNVGGVFESNWLSDSSAFSAGLFDMGNVHKSRLEAEAWLSKYGNAFFKHVPSGREAT